MFGIGLPEILVIMVIALFVIGPDKLPEVAKMLGKTLSEFKKVVDGVKTSIEEEQETIAKEVDTPGLKTSLQEMEENLKKDYEEAAAAVDREKESISAVKDEKKEDDDEGSIV